MKVEESFTIEGVKVELLKVSSKLTYYSADYGEIIYVVSNKDGQVLDKIELDMGMSQGSGYVEQITVKEL